MSDPEDGASNWWALGFKIPVILGILWMIWEGCLR